MPSHSVRPAGKRYSHDGFVGGADAPDGLVAYHGRAGQGQGLRGGHAGCGGAQSGESAGHVPSVRASVRCSGTARHRGRTRRRLARPASWGERGNLHLEQEVLWSTRTTQRPVPPAPAASLSPEAPGPGPATPAESAPPSRPAPLPLFGLRRDDPLPWHPAPVGCGASADSVRSSASITNRG
jgi:hypothetical protein